MHPASQLSYIITHSPGGAHAQFCHPPSHGFVVPTSSVPVPVPGGSYWGGGSLTTVPVPVVGGWMMTIDPVPTGRGTTQTSHIVLLIVSLVSCESELGHKPLK